MRLPTETPVLPHRTDGAPEAEAQEWYDRRTWGLGLGAEVTRDVVRYGFDEVGHHRIGLEVFAHNHRAIRCYERCGFVEEGREGDAAYVGGAWRDDVIMGILQSDPR